MFAGSLVFDRHAKPRAHGMAVNAEDALLVDRIRSPDPDYTNVEEEVWSRNLSETVREALTELSEGEREAISLAYFGGLSYVEVAKKLDQPEGTVKSRIRSGMKKLSISLAGASS